VPGAGRAPSLALALAVCALAATVAPANAHTPGAEPVVREGTILLGVGPPDNEFHVTFEQMGFPIGAGDTFEIGWAVNGGAGPEVNFEIHTHEKGWTRYYNATARALSVTWVVPRANGSFMVDWVNPWPVPVNVTYRFVDMAPPPDLTPLVVLPIAVGAAFGWFLWLRAAPDGGRQDVGGRHLGTARGSSGRDLDDEDFTRAVLEAEAEQQALPERGNGGRE